jgi:hypothetical protein
MKRVNILGKNTEIFNIKANGKNSNHCAFKDFNICMYTSYYLLVRLCSSQVVLLSRSSQPRCAAHNLIPSGVHTFPREGETYSISIRQIPPTCFFPR